MRIAELFVKPEMISSVYTAKWIQLYGTKYVSYNTCIIAVDASFSTKLPLFGKLGNIWLADEEVLFEYMPLTTVEFDMEFMAYKVEEPLAAMAMDFCFYKKLLDFNVYSLQEQNDSLYIPLKYDLRDIIQQHIVGDNPLHF